MNYSKMCIKRPLSKRPKIDFPYQLSLNSGQKYCRMLQSAILSTFKLPFVIKIYVLSIFERPFYTGFTVIYLFKAVPGMRGLAVKDFSWLIPEFDAFNHRKFCVRKLYHILGLNPLSILMNFSIQIYKIRMRMSFIYFKGPKVRISKL